MSSKEPMYSEYIKFYNTYTKKYGPKTTVFMAVGSFYELYDIQNTETGETQCNIHEITNFLGLKLTTKTYAKLKLTLNSEEQIVCAGFPDYSIHKWAGKLTSTGWTVVIVDQGRNKYGTIDNRVVSRILSPSTHIENMPSLDTPYILSLFFQQSAQNNTPIFGAAVLDLTTGTTITYSGITNGRPDIWTADDLIHMINVFQPKEILIYWKSQLPTPDKSYIYRTFGIIQSTPIHIYQIDSLGTFAIELARSEYLQKIYSIKSLFPPKTYLGLRSDQEELALLYLLQFIEEHYPSILKSFHRNKPWTPQSRLICGNHALTQLQMTGSNINETVVNLFNKCITPMGKRAIRDRLLTPYSDHIIISRYLDEVQEYMQWDVLKTKKLEKQLRFMFDLPRLHRKLLCGLVTSSEISGLFQTYAAINSIISEITYDSLLKEPFKKEEWDEYNKVYQTHFSFEKSQQASEDIMPFNSDTYTDISEKENEIENTHAEFKLLKQTIAENGGINDDSISTESRTKEPYGFKCTATVIRQLKKNISALPPGTKFSELKTVGWIDCTKLQQLNTKIQKLREQLEHLVKIHILDACNKISEAGQLIWTNIETWISHIDCTQCIGRISKDRGFVCPEISEPDTSGSSFEIEQLRHPLVEASATRVTYVKHDIRLGGDRSDGWLIYGMNASGKSTLMKATGLCILLAQSGCFVPAKSMKLIPFKSIYTRILNQDNLFAGLSSFAVEMSELRDILKNANSNTLVLGDELCAGTESISAQSLVLSGIQWLSARNAKFIFATHLHGLAEMLSCQIGPRDTELSNQNVQVWHLHVEFDPITKKLIYDRALRPGSGSTLYGLEVAQAMDLPFDFIEQALKNRHMIIGSKCQENTSKSYWNKEIIRKECEVCRKQICSELEVHHIVPRSMATNNILDDGSHMNEKRNLIVICQICHDKVHANKIEIGPLQITSDGPERIIKESNNIETPKELKESKESKEPTISPEPDNTKKKTRKGKWSDDEMTIIRDTLQSYAYLSLKSVRSYLSSKYSIEISEGILGKLRRNVY